MNVLGISGSPRPGSNSECLLCAALTPFSEAGWKVKTILLSNTSIGMCTGCETCVQTGNCVLQDDMAQVAAAFQSCDAVIIASPTYWRNVPAQLKALFDRSYALKTRPLLGKLGGAMAVGRGSGGGQAIVLNAIHNYLLSSGALCVPGELNGVTAIADRPGEILAQPRRLAQARALGENILRHHHP